jgi:enoyl-[acyl-carrier protein] reductase I
VRYTAVELGPKGIRAFAISPGPIETRAASGLAEFQKLIETAKARAPLRRLATIEDVGATTALLATRAGECLTGQTIYVDGGYHITG